MDANVVMDVLGEALVDMSGSKESKPLQEAFDRLATLLNREDQGWVPIFGSNDDDDQFGLKLESLKEWDRKIRESVYGAPWIGAGHRLRHSYIWKDGIRYANLPKATQGKKNLRAVINGAGNQFHFFSEEARRKRELCLYSAGIALWIGNNKTKNLESVPLRQVKDQLLEPTGLGYAVAYLREWTDVDLETGEPTPRKEWYFTDQWEGPVPNVVLTKKLGAEAERIPVSKTHTIFAQHANQGSGLVYGAPDALAAFIWNAIARDAYMDGITMVRALAAFAMKATSKTKRGSENTSIKLADNQTAGQTAVMGAANDLVPLSSAGKGYDFGGLTPLLAMMSTALGVSVIALSSDPGTAGSSYGSAATMDLPSRLAMESRRSEHVAFDIRILKWMGLEDPEVAFIPYEDGAETYRLVQAIMLELQNDLISRQEAREYTDDLHGRPNGKVPTEDQRPSVLVAKALAKATPTPAATSTQTSPTATPGGTSIASPNQGKSNGTGGQGGGAANDLRSDGVSD